MPVLSIPLAVVGDDPIVGHRVKHQDTHVSDASFPTNAATLADLFPPIDALPPTYERLLLHEGTVFCRGLPWATGASVCGEDARAVYTPEGQRGDIIGNVVCRARLAEEDRRSPAARDEYHDIPLWEEFDGEPTLDGFTDWVEADLAEQQVDGHRRTTYWRRSPVLRDGPWRPEEESDLPCSEFAAAVQTTDWGVIHVGVYLTSAPEEGRARRIRDSVIEHFHERVTRLPTPEPLGDALDRTAWTDLAELERREAAAAVAACPGDDDATVSNVLEGLRERYASLPDHAEEVVETVFADEQEIAGEPRGDTPDA